MSVDNAAVGDVIEADSGARYRVMKLGSGSWSGLRTYECKPLSGERHGRSVTIYADETKRIVGRASKASDDATESNSVGEETKS